MLRVRQYIRLALLARRRREWTKFHDNTIVWKRLLFWRKSCKYLLKGGIVSRFLDKYIWYSSLVSPLNLNSFVSWASFCEKKRKQLFMCLSVKALKYFQEVKNEGTQFLNIRIKNDIACSTFRSMSKNTCLFGGFFFWGGITFLITWMLMRRNINRN